MNNNKTKNVMLKYKQMIENKWFLLLLETIPSEFWVTAFLLDNKKNVFIFRDFSANVDIMEILNSFHKYA